MPLLTGPNGAGVAQVLTVGVAQAAPEIPVQNPAQTNDENPQNQTIDDGTFLTTAAIIPIFYGPPDGLQIEAFIRLIDNIASVYNWSDINLGALARMRIQGDADQYLRSVPELVNAPWSEIKKDFLIHFSDHEPFSDIFTKLREYKQDSNESAGNFATRLRLFGNKIRNSAENEVADPNEAVFRNRMIDNEILSTFLRGLKVETRRFVVTSSPKTLREAVQKAQQEEAYLRTAPKH